MDDVEIFEQDLLRGDGVVGKVAILRGGLRSDNPLGHMNEAVRRYVAGNLYNEFVEIEMDNPWVRVVISGINEVEYQEFVNQNLGG